jgi:hypothetical protein
MQCPDPGRTGVERQVSEGPTLTFTVRRAEKAMGQPE